MSTTNEVNVVSFSYPSNEANQVIKASKFLAAWKAAIKSIDPKFFINSSSSLDEAICTMDLEPNLEVIHNQLVSLNRTERYFICFLVSLYDADAGTIISNQVGFNFLRDFISFDDNQKYLVIELLSNFPGSDEYWGAFN